MSAFEEYLRDKRVVLVGPAGSLIGKGYGRAIDQYDVVVRIKKPMPRRAALNRDYGARTDVLYVTLEKCMWEPFDAAAGGVWDGLGVRWVILARKKLRRKTAIMNAGVRDWANFRQIPRKFYNHVQNLCGNTLPLAGVITIADLARMPHKQLHLVGFTFYLTKDPGHYDGFQPPDVAATWSQDEVRRWHATRSCRNSSHYVPPQLNLIRRIVATDQRITVDPVLEGVLSA